MNGAPKTPSFSSPSIPDVSLPSPPDPRLDPAGYLRSIYAIREQSRIVFEKAKRGELRHFDVDGSKWGDVVGFVTSVIRVRRLLLPTLNIHTLSMHHQWTNALCSATSHPTIAKYPLMAAGSTLKSVAGPVLTSSSKPGPALSTHKNAHAGSLTYFSFLYFWMQGQVLDGVIRARRAGGSTSEVRGSR